MSGRLTQLGRQLRKLRHIIGEAGRGQAAPGPAGVDGEAQTAPVTTLRRATQLACDLACEHADVDDAQAAFHDLTGRGIIEPALAERLAAWAASHTDVSSAASQREDQLGTERAMTIGRDLDRFLRSLELGAPAPEAPFEPLVARDRVSRADSTAAVPISGRIVEIEVRHGLAVIEVDEQPIAMTLEASEPVRSFALAAAPTSRAEVHREPTGVTRVVWGPEKLALELAADFTRVRVEQARG
jgi:hypothetical protein